jgi:hypothetical protein
MPRNQERPSNGPLQIHHSKDNTTMLEHGLALAAAGWAIFPCIPNGPNAKAPLIRRGHLNTTTDIHQITTWWTLWPGAMIGARVPESCIVIDIDPRNGGDLAPLETLTGPLPTTLTVWSGRNDGGRHLYFLRPPGSLTSTKLPEGIDLKVNGYCIAPPSIHPATGWPYRWELHPVAAMPHAMRELLRPALRPVTVQRGTGGDGAGLVRTVAEANEGDRHDALVWASYRARDDGILREITEELVAAAAAAGGETETSARRVVASVRRTAS